MEESKTHQIMNSINDLTMLDQHTALPEFLDIRALNESESMDIPMPEGQIYHPWTFATDDGLYIPDFKNTACVSINHVLEPISFEEQLYLTEVFYQDGRKFPSLICYTELGNILIVIESNREA